LYLCDLNHIIWSLTWLPQCKAGSKKWFYIKDQKAANSDQYCLAPFDANKILTKLTTRDSPPSEAKVEGIKPLLAHIQRLKSAAGPD
jgi:hypothetical protein